MKIAVLKEAAGETRCAAIPETVKKFVALGAEVAVEKGAGESASASGDEFEAVGAKIGNRADVLKGASIILCINGPDPAALKGAEKGALLVGALDPARRREAIDGYASAGLEALAMEWMPRITRAQSMDILSSQSNLAGYKAVIEAAGSSMDKVVKTTVFLTDLNDFGAMNEIYGSFFQENPPARSTVQVVKLARDAAVEIEAVALA